MTPDPAELDARLALARAAAAEARTGILRRFQDPDLAVETKSDASPVTDADRAAEELLRERIGAEFPEDGILGEEFGETAGGSGFRWILDPIDGTKSFIHGVPLFGTLLGVEHEGRSVLGVIALPALDEEVFARAGGGAWWRRGNAPPVPAAVTATGRLAASLVCTTSSTSFARAGRPLAYPRLAEAAGLVRGWGDCYGYSLVATGRAEAMVDPLMNVWDTAALLPVIEEAGGRFTDWAGEATIHGGCSVATNGRIHEEVLSILALRGR